MSSLTSIGQEAQVTQITSLSSAHFRDSRPFKDGRVVVT